MEHTAEVLTGNDIVEALNWRYATKKFDPEKKLGDEQVESLLETIRLSASSMGLQPYRFIHVKDEALRRELRSHSYDQPQITDASELIVFAAKEKFTDEDISQIVEREGEIRGYDKEKIEKRVKSVTKYVRSKNPDEFFAWTGRQTYIAIGKLLSAAALMRVDACPMEGIKGEDYDRILGLETLNLRSLAVVTLGFRSENDAYASKPKVRLPKDQIIKTF
jgi:nitroreductase